MKVKSSQSREQQHVYANAKNVRHLITAKDIAAGIRDVQNAQVNILVRLVQQREMCQPSAQIVRANIRLVIDAARLLSNCKNGELQQEIVRKIMKFGEFKFQIRWIKTHN